MVQDVVDLGREVMVPWLARNYEDLKTDLYETTPIGHAAPFEDTFYYAWHSLFGIANRILVEEGMFADPYDPGRKYQGFIPVVWHSSLYE